MTTAHTAGPWKAHPTGQARSGKPEYEIHWSDIGECVAEIVHGEADARLIVAAPDLLAALNEISLMWHADRIATSSDSASDTTFDFDKLMERVEVLTFPFRVPA